MVSVKAGAWKWVGLADGQMSALGQKRTCALQNVMSALPPMNTAKADILAKTHQFLAANHKTRVTLRCF